MKLQHIIIAQRNQFNNLSANNIIRGFGKIGCVMWMASTLSSCSDEAKFDSGLDYESEIKFDVEFVNGLSCRSYEVDDSDRIEYRNVQYFPMKGLSENDVEDQYFILSAETSLIAEKSEAYDSRTTLNDGNIDSFYVSAYKKTSTNDNNGLLVFVNESFEKSLGDYYESNSKPTMQKEGGYYDFYAHTDFGTCIQELTTEYSTNYPVFRYDAKNGTNDNAEDFMVACARNIRDDYGQAVQLNFSHIFAGVRFVASEISEEFTIKSISFLNIYDIADFSFSQNYTNDFDRWISKIKSYNAVTINDLNITTSCDDTEITPQNEASFMMIPQILPTGAKISVKYELNGVQKTVMADISGEWMPGTITTYTLNCAGVVLNAEQNGLSIQVTTPRYLRNAKVTLYREDKPGVNLLSGNSDDGSFILPDDGKIRFGYFIDNIIDSYENHAYAYLEEKRHNYIIRFEKNGYYNERTISYKFDYMQVTETTSIIGYAATLPSSWENIIYPGLYFMNLRNKPIENFTIGISVNKQQHQEMKSVYPNPGSYSDIGGVFTFPDAETYPVRVYSDLSCDDYALPPNSKSVSNALNIISIDTPILPSYSGDYSMYFYGAPISLAPSYTFEKCSNAESFYRVFDSCILLETISAHLFEKAELATDFSYAFNDCYILSSIDARLFQKNKNATNFDHTFCWCKTITTIPAGLFINGGSNFKSTFEECRSIQSIPAGLFDNGGTNFDHTFCGCNNIRTIPFDLFDKRYTVTSLCQVFSGCWNVRSKVPELWDTDRYPAWKYPFTRIDHGAAFYSCSKAENYESIPSGWK